MYFFDRYSLARTALTAKNRLILVLFVVGCAVPCQATEQPVTTVAAGGHHTMFLKADGTLWAVGMNANGQLGDGSAVDRSIPVQVAEGVIAVAAGSRHTAFVKKGGTLWAMGNNDYGQLGDGTTTERNRPIEVASGVVSIAVGYRHTAFVKTDGTLWAMGENFFGQLGAEKKGSSENSVGQIMIKWDEDRAYRNERGFYSGSFRSGGSRGRRP